MDIKLIRDVNGRPYILDSEKFAVNDTCAAGKRYTVITIRNEQIILNEHETELLADVIEGIIKRMRAP